MDWEYVTDVYRAIDEVIPDRVVLVGSAAIDAYLHHHKFKPFVTNDLDFIAMIDYLNVMLPDEIMVNRYRDRTQTLYTRIGTQSRNTPSKTFESIDGSSTFDLSKFNNDKYYYVELDGIKVLDPQTLIRHYKDGLENSFLWREKLNVAQDCETDDMEKMYVQNLHLKLSLLSIINSYHYDVKTLNLRKPRESRYHSRRDSFEDSGTTSPPYDHERGGYPGDFGVARTLFDSPERFPRSLNYSDDEE